MKTFVSLAALTLLFFTHAAFADTAFTATPKTGTVPLTVSFSGPTPATQNMYTLNFGDGSTSVTVSQWPVSHTYSSAGAYTAKLYVQETALPVATASITVTSPGGGTACLMLENDFGQGDTDDDTDGEVSKLQSFLAQDPNIYPEGKVTGYFGALTVKAVQRFQAAHGISQTGYVGPKTRAALADCTNTGNSSITVSVSPSSVVQGNTAVISWKSMNVATNTAVSLRLLNSNGVRRGLIAVGRPASGTFSWTIPYGTGKPEDIINGIANCSTGGICTGTLAVGNYFIQAALYSPANAFEEETQPTVVAVSNKAPLAVTAKNAWVPPPTEPSCSLSVQPASIKKGESATLVWFSSNATGGTISGIGNVAVSGSQTVSPVQSTVYIGTFTGAGGTATCNASITVTGGTGSVISLTAVPSTGTSPLPVIFTWVSSNANTLQFGDGQSASVPATGATSHTYSSAGTFTAKLLAGTSVLTTTTVTATGGGGGGGTTHANCTPVATGSTILSASPSTGAAPLSVTVSFALPSSFPIDAIDFGDGAKSAIPQAQAYPYHCLVHTYTTAGTYAVRYSYQGGIVGPAYGTSVTVTGGGGGGGGGILSLSPSSGAAPLTVTASVDTPNLEFGSFYQVQWGDGSANSAPIRRRTDSASHTYTSAGTFTATLTLCSSQDGVTCYPGTTGVVETKTVTVTGGGGGGGGGGVPTDLGCSNSDPAGNMFCLKLRGDKNPLTVQLVNWYQGPVYLTVEWGDGTSENFLSSEQNTERLHPYGQSGTYLVRVYHTSSGGQNAVSKTITLGSCNVLGGCGPRNPGDPIPQ